jgi:hypothetical protein
MERNYRLVYYLFSSAALVEGIKLFLLHPPKGEIIPFYPSPFGKGGLRGISPVKRSNLYRVGGWEIKQTLKTSQSPPVELLYPIG